MTLESIIKDPNCIIIDVRSHEEFMGGHVTNAINIPLQTIPSKIEDFKKMGNPIVLCCASGNRSGQAQHFLSQNNIECHNGGSWLDVNYYQSKQ